VPFAALAEDDRLEEGRPAEAIDVVELDRRLEQAADDRRGPRSAARIRPVPL